MLFYHILQHIPYFLFLAFYHSLGRLNIVSLALCYEFSHNERLEELYCHLLGETALIDLQLRSYNNNRTS